MNREKYRCISILPVLISLSGIYFVLKKYFNLKLWDIKSIEIKDSANDKMIKNLSKREYGDWLQAMKIKWITFSM